MRRAPATKSLAEGAWHRQAVDIVATETLIDHALLNAVTGVFLCDPPTDLVKAEVVVPPSTGEGNVRPTA